MVLPHHLQVVLATSLDPAFAIDDRRRYIRVSDAAAELLGLPADDIPGHTIDEFCPPSFANELERLWEEFRRDGSHSGAGPVLRADGTHTSVRYRMGRDVDHGLHLAIAREIAGPSRLGGALTRREHEVLQLAANGLAATEIAGALAVSRGTVKTHFQNLYSKLGVHDRAAAVAAALRRGLID